MKYILEYDEKDIRDLMGDLDAVGQMKTFRGTLWARFNTYRLFNEPGQPVRQPRDWRKN